MLHRAVQIMQCASIILPLMLFSSPVLADDPAATSVTKLFMQACVPNMGRPDQVRSWAKASNFPEITAPQWLKIFVGEGTHGGAWTVILPTGNFAVSIRGISEGCVAWAQAANVAEATSNFQRLVEGVRRPGLTVSVAEDKTIDSPFGHIRSLTYKIMPNQGQTGYEFILVTVERSGGPFQVSMEVVRGKDA